MKKEVVFVLTFIFILPMVPASLSSGMDEIQNYVDQYKAGTISAPQLVVYIEYVKNKIYEELDKEGVKAFTEAEIETVFDKTDLGGDGKRDWRFTQYEKRFKTDDFHVVFRADSFFRHDREYYEKRETTAENYYIINYELVAVNVAGADLSNEIRDFISDLKAFVDEENVIEKEYDEMRKRLNKIKQKFQEMRSMDNCVELMGSIGMEEHEKDYPSNERNFYYLIEEKIEKNCWNEPKCEPVCESIEVCDDCEPECWDEEVCGVVCEDVFNNETNSTESICEDVCSMQEVCSVCEETCRTKENCYVKCIDVERCDEYREGEIRIRANCREKGNNLHSIFTCPF